MVRARFRLNSSLIYIYMRRHDAAVLAIILFPVVRYTSRHTYRGDLYRIDARHNAPRSINARGDNRAISATLYSVSCAQSLFTETGWLLVIPVLLIFLGNVVKGNTFCLVINVKFTNQNYKLTILIVRLILVLYCLVSIFKTIIDIIFIYIFQYNIKIVVSIM